jgi:uncharacterized membrane protein YccC
MDFPWLDILKNFGPLIAIVIFFIWRDWQRELKLTRRIEKLEDYQKKMLQNLVERTTAALVQSSECLKWMGHIVERLSNVCPKIYGQDCENNDSNQS